MNLILMERAVKALEAKEKVSRAEIDALKTEVEKIKAEKP